MFTTFFYLLRKRGLDVSLNEWITLLEGMERGLHRSTLTGFYHLCRAVLVKNETEFDRFDQVFLEFFKDVSYTGELPEEMWDWLSNPEEDLGRIWEQLKMKESLWGRTMDELLQGLEDRLETQTEQHNGGRRWVGTQGHTPWGNSGWNPRGIRMEGHGQFQAAMTVAGERKFRDFRKDNTLDPRQFQMAFRLLRQLSVQTDSNEKELDIGGTVRRTGDHGGLLNIQYQRPRKNTVKVLLLMDSGGSMDHFSRLCSMLFQAATKSNYFKEMHTYYFHNCIYADLYKDPKLERQDAVPTEWVLQNFDSSYKVIIVGDASMNPYELYDSQFNWGIGTYGPSGLEWLELLKKHFPHIIWLNPEPTPEREDYRTQTHCHLRALFEMFPLTPEGIEQGMRYLMVYH